MEKVTAEVIGKALRGKEVGESIELTAHSARLLAHLGRVRLSDGKAKAVKTPEPESKEPATESGTPEVSTTEAKKPAAKKTAAKKTSKKRTPNVSK